MAFLSHFFQLLADLITCLLDICDYFFCCLYVSSVSTFGELTFLCMLYVYTFLNSVIFILSEVCHF